MQTSVLRSTATINELKPYQNPLIVISLFVSAEKVTSSKN